MRVSCWKSSKLTGKHKGATVISVNRDLSRAFNPGTVAVVGDKQANDFLWLHNMEHFQGQVYSVQIDPAEARQIEALGYKNFQSLLDIPEPVDYVVVATPRAVTPRIIHDCIQKKVGGVALFTSGFAETATEEGIRLQKILQTMARESNLNLIGPNCMGIFNPALGVRHSPDQYYNEAGNVGFISQSGTEATLFSIIAARHGIKISKSVSYGNAIVLDAPDYLDYLAEDKQTRAIGMYIEGTNDGRRLLVALEKAILQKPVVVWKGGATDAGIRAIATHTASLTKSPLLWDTALRQAGAITVDGLNLLIDTLNMLLQVRKPAGNRTGLVAISGGQSVTIADAFARAGLLVPALTDNSYRELAGFFNIIGGNYSNPIDISWTVPSIELLVKILAVLDHDQNLDIVVLELPAFFLIHKQKADSTFLRSLLEALSAFQAQATKPFITILTSGDREREALEIRQTILDNGILSFPDCDRAARAVAKVAAYEPFLRKYSNQTSQRGYS